MLPVSLKQMLSIIGTLAIYCVFFGWKAAALIVITIGFHEMCHLAAARYLNLPTSGWVLVPFMGGVSFISGEYKRYTQKVFVVFAGPIGGGALALLVGAMYFFFRQEWMRQACAFMLFVNAFNLLPLSFLDGGQLINAINTSINKTLAMVYYIASTFMAVMIFSRYNFFLAIIIGLIGGIDCASEYNNWKFFRAGKTYLCTDSYLNPPQLLSRNLILKTIFVWLLSAGIMLVMFGILNQSNTTVSFNFFFHK